MFYFIQSLLVLLVYIFIYFVSTYVYVLFFLVITILYSDFGVIIRSEEDLFIYLSGLKKYQLKTLINSINIISFVSFSSVISVIIATYSFIVSSFNNSQYIHKILNFSDNFYNHDYKIYNFILIPLLYILASLVILYVYNNRVLTVRKVFNEFFDERTYKIKKKFKNYRPEFNSDRKKLYKILLYFHRLREKIIKN